MAESKTKKPPLFWRSDSPNFELNNEDWESILSELRTVQGSRGATRRKVIKAVEKLRASGNRPTFARELFEGVLVNCASEKTNSFLKDKAPYRMVRIGDWNQGKKRKDRLLAMVKIDNS